MNLTFLEEQLLNDKTLRRIIYLDEIDSTNLYAKKNLTEDNTLVIASNQTKGTGRFERRWESQPGKNLTVSVIKGLSLSPGHFHLVNFYASYILYKTVIDFLNTSSGTVNFTDKGLFLKWPNDLIFNGKKIAGILTEMKDENEKKTFIIGIGLNINQEKFDGELNSSATSLFIETGIIFSIEEILISYIKNFYENLTILSEKCSLIQLWKSKTDILGKQIRFRQSNNSSELSGEILDIENDGAIKIKFNDNSILKFYSGEITHLRQ